MTTDSHDDRIILLSNSLNNGGAAIAAQRWKECLHVDRTITFENARSWRRKLAQVLLRIERSLTKSIWDRDLLGPTSISIFGCYSYSELRKLEGRFLVHWVQNNFLSIYTLAMISKRSIFYLHDEWFLLGIGHYSGDSEVQNFATFVLAPIKRAILRNSQLILVPSYWLKSRLIEEGLSSERIEVLPNPLPCSFLRQTQESKKTFKVQKSGSSHVFAFVAYSVADKRKGLHYFIDAFNILRTRYPDIRGIIVGRGAKNYAHLDGFSFSEFIDDETSLRDFFLSIDCLVIPSISDNLPQTATQAQALGTRIITNFQGGSKEAILEPNLSGMATDVSDSDAFALTMENLLNIPWTDEDRKRVSMHANRKWSYHSISLRFQALFDKDIHALHK